MTPTQTTPPASPASPVPTKEAIAAAQWCNNRRFLPGEKYTVNLHELELAARIDSATHLPELLAIKEAAERAEKVWDRRNHEHLCYPNTYASEIEAMADLGQSLTAYARAAGTSPSRAETK